MSENSKLLSEQAITRRAFLKGSAGAAVLVITAGSIGTLLAACAKPTADFEVTSSTDFNHIHKVKILGADIDRPPAEKVITSDGATHQHTVTLSKTDFQALKKGQEVTLTSSAVGATPHTHTFALKVPAA